MLRQAQHGVETEPPRLLGLDTALISTSSIQVAPTRPAQAEQSQEPLLFSFAKGVIPWPKQYPNFLHVLM